MARFSERGAGVGTRKKHIQAVATLLLGVADGHPGNVIDRHFFHIDFGHFLETMNIRNRNSRIETEEFRN
jgi:hypothetical protein